MADRIILGERGQQMGLWVSLPGQNVGDPASRMVFSSDTDYLKIHAQGFYQIPRLGSTNNPYRYQGQITFPDLPYYPLHVCSFATDNDNRRVFFPNDNGENSSTLPNSEYVITGNAIYFYVTGFNYSQNVFVRYIIFKNKMADR